MVTTRPPRRVLRDLEQVLWVIGILCLAWVAWNTAHRLAAQRAYEVAMSDEILATDADARDAGTPPVADPATAPVPLLRRPGEVIGRLEVPRLRLSAMIAEGDDDITLKGAVGHLPDTPLPWQSGNSALAGHRDTFFRMLRGVKVGDRIVMSTPEGRIEYRVNRMTIVQPEDLWVLDPAPQVDLTLITCYPFTYIGKAPQRYVVHAAKLAGPGT